jgi:GNAT superfamily N-acetyltransferase
MIGNVTTRLATPADLVALNDLMTLAIDRLQNAFLSHEQVIASRAIMGLDTQLIHDQTYFMVEEDGIVAGCGGWSRRATLYGGDHSASRDAALLDPLRDAARVRAMYTHPNFVRRGVGRRILDLCEKAAAAERFGRVELMATLSGQPLYAACGYSVIEPAAADVDGVSVPLIRMGKHLSE